MTAEPSSSAQTERRSLRSTIERGDCCDVSVVTIAEIQSGIEKAREQDTERAAAIEAWLDAEVDRRLILPLTLPIMRKWAKLMHRRSDALMIDALIAATALHHGLAVVTRNRKDFEPFGVLVTNPFTARS